MGFVSNVKKVRAYCKVCMQTILVPISSNMPEIAPGGLIKHTYVHEGSNGQSSHAIVLTIDGHYSVRRAEVTDLCVEFSQCPADISLQVYCQRCKRDVNISVGNQEFNTFTKEIGLYKQSYIHGRPNHSLMVIIDGKKTLRRAEVTNLDVSTFTETTETSSKEKISYSTLGLYKMSIIKSIFEALFVFDRRARTVLSFYNKEFDHILKEYSIKDIALRMEEDLENMTRLPQAPYLFSFLDENMYTYVMSEKYEICIVGINLQKTYYPWLQLLSNVLASENESPNTLGLEIFFQIMEIKKRNLPEESTINDLLFSPIFSVQDTFKYDRTLRRQFPNTADLFQQCALGKYSILEAINTKKGLQHFDELISLIYYVENRK